MKWQKRGQVTAEAAVLFTFIVAAFVAMGVYLQRGSQGGMKGNVDSMGSQFATTASWSTVTNSATHSNSTATVTGQCANSAHDLVQPGLPAGSTSGKYTAASGCTPGTPTSFGGSGVTLP